MIDLSKIQLTSTASSNKVLKEDSDSFTVPAITGSGTEANKATIAHGHDSDNLLFQVAADGAGTDGVVLPWASNDGRVILYAHLDDTNLYIVCVDSSSSSLGQPARTIDYSYRILIP